MNKNIGEITNMRFINKDTGKTIMEVKNPKNVTFVTEDGTYIYNQTCKDENGNDVTVDEIRS